MRRLWTEKVNSSWMYVFLSRWLRGCLSPLDKGLFECDLMMVFVRTPRLNQRVHIVLTLGAEPSDRARQTLDVATHRVLSG